MKTPLKSRSVEWSGTNSKLRPLEFDGKNITDIISGAKMNLIFTKHLEKLDSGQDLFQPRGILGICYYCMTKYMQSRFALVCDRFGTKQF